MKRAWCAFKTLLIVKKSAVTLTQSGTFFTAHRAVFEWLNAENLNLSEGE